MKKLWEPSAARQSAANMTAYMGWLSERTGQSFSDYGSLYQWSIANLEEF
jgi:acetoacetyl-CoA synthetase